MLTIENVDCAGDAFWSGRHFSLTMGTPLTLEEVYKVFEVSTRAFVQPMEDSRLTLVFFSIPFSSPAFINLVFIVDSCINSKTVLFSDGLQMCQQQ